MSKGGDETADISILSYHNRKQNQKIIKSLFKGGDEAADISAGFHLHRRGGVAQVEHFSSFVTFLTKHFQLINFLFICFLSITISLDYPF